MSVKLALELSKIILKLKSKVKTRIFQAGTARARDLLNSCANSGVFDWAGEMKAWLQDPKVIFYLGVSELFGC